MAEWNPRVNDLFLQAVQHADAAERKRFLDHACGGDAQLRQAVDTLLQAHEQAGGFLEQPHPAAGAVEQTGAYFPSSSSPAEAPGTIVAGKYKLLQQIGEGGMGSVWMADQLEPVKRRVAVKLIRAERDGSRTILSRFEAERQAIALMDHPNIAKLLDAAETPPADAGGSPRPFFVMELVKGVALTEFCDEHKLSVPQRLQLFMQICSAVQHAHQKGIIHRDLKPTNILVEMHDDKPVPKVIDFGLAKALSGQPLTEHTLFTGFGTVAGTPLYMAPEQAKFNAIDIDTRADVYALGVILYELLTGSTPIERATLKKAAFDEILRVIRESEPPTPSKRLSSTESKPSIAANRQMEPLKLGRFVKGDLDWIVMKALSKERDRRYETANGFAKDVERFLNHEPVTAGPPSASYKLRKFVQRNKPQVVAAGLVLLALIGGIAGTTIGLVRAEHQRQEAQQARADEAEQRRIAQKNEAAALASAEAEKQAKLRSESREAETRAVLNFVENRVLASARPAGQDGGLGSEVKLTDAIRASMPYLESGFQDQPLIEARLRMTIGTSFFYLGHAEVAERMYQRARSLLEQKLGPDHPDTLSCLNNLANSYFDLGRLDEARKLREKTLAAQKRVLTPDHPDALTSMMNLASVYYALGRHDEARKLNEETLAARQRVLPSGHPDTLQSMLNLANNYFDLGRHDEARKLREETLAARRRVLPPDHPDTLKSMNNLAVSNFALGRFDEARKLHEETLAARRRVLTPDHPDTLQSMNNLANSYSALGRHDEARKLHEETLAARKRVLPLDHPDTLLSMMGVANSYTAQGRHDEARNQYEETLAAQKRVLPPDHPDALRSMLYLATSYYALGRHDEARRRYEETLAAQKRVLPPDHLDTLRSMMGLANSYYALGRLDDARTLHEETLTARKRVLPPDHPETLGSMNNLANCYYRLGRHDEALKLREETLAARKRVLPPDHPETLGSMMGLANSYFFVGRRDEALKLREETLATLKRVLPPDHPDTLASMYNLAISNEALGRHEEARKLYEETLTAMKRVLPPDHPNILRSMNGLARFLATIPNAALRDPTRAVALANEVAEKSPNKADFLSTLGIARYRAGDWKTAVADLEKTISLRRPDDPDNADAGFFLAMANWQLGDKDKAREWYDKAAAWMAKVDARKTDAELKHFRAEAAELLGAR